MAQGNGDSGFYEEAKHLIKNLLVTNDFSTMERNTLRDELGISAIEADLISREDAQRRKIETRRNYFEKWKNSHPMEQGENTSYFDENTGGFYLTYVGHGNDTASDQLEYDAARIMAENGEIVRLFPESGRWYTTPFYPYNQQFKEGKIGNTWFEQKSPDGGDLAKKALVHARTKGADVAVLYDINGEYNVENLPTSIKRYKNQPHNSDHRVKMLYIINGKTRKVSKHIVK